MPRLSVRLLLPRTLIFSTAHQRRSLPPPPAPASSSLSISAKSAATTAAAKVAHRQEMGRGGKAGKEELHNGRTHYDGREGGEKEVAP